MQLLSVCVTDQPLIGSLLRVLQYLQFCQQREPGTHTDSEASQEDEEEEEDVQLRALKETTAEFLASILTDLTKVRGHY